MIPHIESARWNTVERVLEEEKGKTLFQVKETEQQTALEELLLEYT
jgi:hypothetical protein